MTANNKLTDEEAREILAAFLAEKTTTIQAEAEHAWMLAEVQLQIVKGPHASDIAALAALAINGDERAQEQAQAIIEELYADAQLKLAKEGLPPEWRPPSSTN